MIYGNKEGIRDSLLAQLETLYDLDLSAEVLLLQNSSMFWQRLPARLIGKSVFMFPAAARFWISRSAD